jgi:divalent metal cation (Fe/Co/Zn/Cd) transporter
MAGFPLADPIAGLLITVAILAVLPGAARDIYRRLMDAVDPALTETANEKLAGTPGVVGVEYLRIRWIGHRITLPNQCLPSSSDCALLRTTRWGMQRPPGGSAPV